MKKRNIIYIAAIFSATILAASCSKKLDIKSPSLVSQDVFASASGYKSVLAKVYGSYANTGSTGEGSGDIQGIDAGTSDFLRLLWCAEELPTDEAVVGWGDAGLPDFHNISWSSDNVFTKGLYYRCLYQITLANDFISQSSAASLSEHGISGASADSIKPFVAEARFLRAFQYSVLMNEFGNPPFIIAESPLPVGVNPPQIARADLFTFIEKELKAIEPMLADAKTNEYGRVDKAGVWALLARLYLNAGVYTGTPRWTDAATYSKKVIDAGYTLLPDYTKLMRADNNISNTEVILSINYDGLHTKNWGGTTFLTHAAVGGSMTAADYGIDNGWAGLRTTSAFVDKFNYATSLDTRAQFYSTGQTKSISSISNFGDGYGVTKYKNITSAGGAAQNPTFSDEDFPLFRLAEQYLIYAEAVSRGGSGDITLALSYLNKLRYRAFNSSYGTADVGKINASDLTGAAGLQLILDERARELYWEATRRTDLIRFNQFTTSTYLWPWKGGVATGTEVSTNRNLYPIPSSDLTANSNLKQNTGY